MQEIGVSVDEIRYEDCVLFGVPVYRFFVCSARDGAAYGRGKSGKGGGIGPGAFPMSNAGRFCRLFLLLTLAASQMAARAASSLRLVRILYGALAMERMNRFARWS